jgi:hypothetical protein
MNLLESLIFRNQIFKLKELFDTENVELDEHFITKKIVFIYTLIFLNQMFQRVFFLCFEHKGLLKDANGLGVVCLCDSFLCRKLQLSLPQKNRSTESCRLLEQSHLVITCNKHL